MVRRSAVRSLDLIAPVEVFHHIVQFLCVEAQPESHKRLIELILVDESILIQVGLFN